jgi:hypothetical protein
MIGDPAIHTSEDRVYLGQKLQITADAFEGRSRRPWSQRLHRRRTRKRARSSELTLANPQLPQGQRLLRPGMIVTVRRG